MLAAEVIDVSPHSHLVRMVVVTDAAKAYDNVSHEVIIKNMEGLGIPLKITRIVHSFKRDWEFTIRLNGKNVGSYTSNRGVPQGSVLAPTLFNLAIIPLAWTLEKINDISFILYAHDVTLWHTHTDLKTQEKLQDALNELDEYMRNTGLALSPHKSYYIQIANKNVKKKGRTVQLWACHRPTQTRGSRKSSYPGTGNSQHGHWYPMAEKA